MRILLLLLLRRRRQEGNTCRLTLTLLLLLHVWRQKGRWDGISDSHMLLLIMCHGKEW